MARLLDLFMGHPEILAPRHLSHQTQTLLDQDCETIQAFIARIESTIHRKDLSETAVHHLFVARGYLEKALGNAYALQNKEERAENTVSLHSHLRSALNSLEDALYYTDPELHSIFEPMVTRLMIFLKDVKQNLYDA